MGLLTLENSRRHIGFGNFELQIITYWITRNCKNKSMGPTTIGITTKLFNLRGFLTW